MNKKEDLADSERRQRMSLKYDAFTIRRTSFSMFPSTLRRATNQADLVCLEHDDTLLRWKWADVSNVIHWRLVHVGQRLAIRRQNFLTTKFPSYIYIYIYIYICAIFCLFCYIAYRWDNESINLPAETAANSQIRTWRGTQTKFGWLKKDSLTAG